MKKIIQFKNEFYIRRYNDIHIFVTWFMVSLANKKKYFILVMESSKNDLHTFYIRSILLWLIFLLTHLFDRFLNWFIKKWNKSSKLYLSFSLPFLPWNFHITMILWETFKKRYFMSLQISAHKCYWFLNSNISTFYDFSNDT